MRGDEHRQGQNPLGRVAVIVMAKSPVPGRVKTRLCPPLTPVQAAQLAAAALADTLGQVNLLARRRSDVSPMLALSGDLSDAMSRVRLGRMLFGKDPWQVFAQWGGSFADRLAHAHQFCDGQSAGAEMTFQIGMDTPQITAGQLAGGLQRLRMPGVDAVLGPAADGGWWALGLRRPELAEVLREVPMSTPETAERTVAALRGAGAQVAFLETLTDVDTIADAEAVARSAPQTSFSRALLRLSPAARMPVTARIAAAAR